MQKLLSFLFLICFLTSCATLPADRDISGVWVDEQGLIYCLDKDGTLGLPGQEAISGLTWRLNHETLQLATLDAPSSAPSIRTLTLKSSPARTLELAHSDGYHETWTRSNIKVERLEGRLFYRERIALPPKVMLEVQLYPPHGGARPLAMTLRPVTGGDLSFRLYYLPQTTPAEVRLSAAILLNSEALFFTDADQQISLNNQPEILLRQARSGEYQLAALAIPARYKGALPPPGKGEVELFLEDHDIALLRSPQGLTLASWLEKERNRVIEIARGELPPLRITRNSEGGDITLSGLDSSNSITLSPVPNLALPNNALFLEGELRQVDGKPVFAECTSLRDLPVDASSRGYAQLHALAGKGESTVVLEGNLRGGFLDVQKVFQVHKGAVCSTGQYASAPLTGTYWRLRELNGKAVQSFPGQNEPHLIFADKGRASGSDGCNNYFMNWKRNGQKLNFSEGGTTLRLCLHGEEQAREMHKMLSSVDSWNISGSKLELRSSKHVTAVFEAVDM